MRLKHQFVGRRLRTVEMPKDNRTFVFSPELWRRWMARDQPDAQTEKLARGIAEFRELLGK